LFTVIYDDKELPVEDIWAALTSTKTKPNMATLQRTATDPDSLYELEKSTQDIVSAIMANGAAGTVKIPGVELVSPLTEDRVTDFVL
jgi:Chromatin associated protein KTI12